MYYIRIGSTPTFLYFDLYLYTAYAAHCLFHFWYRYLFSLAQKGFCGLSILVRGFVFLKVTFFRCSGYTPNAVQVIAKNYMVEYIERCYRKERKGLGADHPY